MFRPALAALAFAVMAALSGGAQAHDTNTGRYGVFGAPFFYDFAHRGDGRYDRRNDGRHVHFRNGKRLVHSHRSKNRRHEHGKGWSRAYWPGDDVRRHTRDWRDFWRDDRWRDSRRDDRWRDEHRHDGRRDGRHDHDARNDDHDGDRGDWRDSRQNDGARWRDRRRNNDN